MNQTELGRDVALPQPTVHRYLNLLETSYLLVRLQPCSINRTKRLIKSPKLRAEVLYWRTAAGEEVDFVVETGDHLLPIEVKATSKPRIADIAHLRAFRAEYGKKSRAGLLLHTGTTLQWLTPDVLAAPWWRVLG